MGVVNCRYTLVLDGKTDPETRKRTGPHRCRGTAAAAIDEGVDFDWQPDVWYTVKLAVEQKEKTAHVRGKVWKKGEAEPEKWTIEFEDPQPEPRRAPRPCTATSRTSSQSDEASRPSPARTSTTTT